jgi:hypothetical protein
VGAPRRVLTKGILNPTVGSITKVYSTEQKEDHQKYKSIYSTTFDEYAMADRASR